ncbi:MAG TPA: hypothetical protein VFC51_10845 [Chloroflexota bacterium]|nr:hypothetical protein [Chloroflexota bacterium]
MELVRTMPSPLAKYRYLAEIRDENGTLYHRVVVDHLEALLPIVYTPRVWDACLAWSRSYTRPRGLYISTQHRGRTARVMRIWPRSEGGIIVVTDGGRS